MKAYHGHILFTPTSQQFEIIANGYVLVDDGGVVESVFAADALPKRDDIEVVELGNKLLIPAMNDLHVHAPQLANMGLAMDMPLLPWLNKYTFPEEAKFADEDYARKMYSRFVSELVKHGTMRAAVFATVHTSATLCLADLCHQAGIGAYIGVVGMDRNSPDNLRNTTDEAIASTQALCEHVSAYPRVKAIITPRFVPSCSPEMLTALAQQARELNLPIQSHLCETPKEIEWVLELEPQAACYADVYRHYGLLNEKTLMAHAVYPSEKDIELLLQTRATVVHCPTSNCNLGSGIAPIRQLLEAGVNIAMGTDVAAGHHLSMFRTMQYAIQMSKVIYAQHNREVSFLTLPEVFYMATKGGGKFFGQVGSFEAGYEFDALVIDDAALVDTLGTSPEQLYERFERFIYTGSEHQIERRFCSGREVVFRV